MYVGNSFTYDPLCLEQAAQLGGNQKGQPRKVTHYGKLIHEAKQCWLNPSSNSHRPELTSKAAAKALNPLPGLVGSTGNSNNNNNRATTTSGANEALT